MNLRDLRYLVAIAEHRHFGRAARACYVSQPTLSTQIKKLETYLGAQLIERNRRRVLLTPLGEQLAQRARGILAQVDDLVSTARAQGEPMTGELRLGIIPTAGPYLLPHIVPQLRDAWPELRLILREDLTDRLVDALRAGTLDGAIMARPVADEALHSETLCVEPFYLAVPTGHPLDEPGPARIADLAAVELLLLEEGHCLRQQALDVCHNVDAEEVESFRGTSLETLRQMVVAGAGVTLLPALAAASSRTGPDRRRLRLRPFHPPAPARELALYWRSGCARTRTLQEIVQSITTLPALTDPSAELLESDTA